MVGALGPGQPAPHRQLRPVPGRYVRVVAGLNPQRDGHLHHGHRPIRRPVPGASRGSQRHGRRPLEDLCRRLGQVNQAIMYHARAALAMPGHRIHRTLGGRSRTECHEPDKRVRGQPYTRGNGLAGCRWPSSGETSSRYAFIAQSRWSGRWPKGFYSRCSGRMAAREPQGGHSCRSAG